MPSQYDEDEIIARLLPQEHGHYMDVGCGNPVDLSNTDALYRRGWRGVVADPRFILSYQTIELWKQSRPEDVRSAMCAGASNEIVTLHISGDLELTSVIPGWSHSNVGRKLEYGTSSLYDIWHNMAPESFGAHPDFLSLDVEGAESLVIMSNQWEKFSPKVLCIESLEYITTRANYHDWEVILLGHGYEFVAESKGHLNRFYHLGGAA